MQVSVQPSLRSLGRLPAKPRKTSPGGALQEVALANPFFLQRLRDPRPQLVRGDASPAQLRLDEGQGARRETNPVACMGGRIGRVVQKTALHTVLDHRRDDRLRVPFSTQMAPGLLSASWTIRKVMKRYVGRLQPLRFIAQGIDLGTGKRVADPEARGPGRTFRETEGRGAVQFDVEPAGTALGGAQSGDRGHRTSRASAGVAIRSERTLSRGSRPAPPPTPPPPASRGSSRAPPGSAPRSLPRCPDSP